MIFQKKIFKIIVLVTLVGLIGSAAYLLYSYRSQLNQLKKEKETLEVKNSSLEKGIADKNNEIDELKKENEALKQSAQSNKTDINTGQTSSQPESQTSSIYDKVVGGDEFKAKIFAALNLLKANDNEHFQMVENQVSNIYNFVLT